MEVHWWFLIARRAQQLKEEADKINKLYGENKAVWNTADVSSADACRESVEKCLSTIGRLAIMVLCAWISGKSPRTIAEGFDTDEYRRVLGVNLDGTFFTMKYGWEACAAHGRASVIMTDSPAGFKASGILYLASDASEWVTGHCLMIDGGEMCGWKGETAACFYSVTAIYYLSEEGIQALYTRPRIIQSTIRE